MCPEVTGPSHAGFPKHWPPCVSLNCQVHLRTFVSALPPAWDAPWTAECLASGFFLSFRDRRSEQSWGEGNTLKERRSRTRMSRFTEKQGCGEYEKSGCDYSEFPALGSRQDGAARCRGRGQEMGGEGTLRVMSRRVTAGTPLGLTGGDTGQPLREESLESTHWSWLEVQIGNQDLTFKTRRIKCEQRREEARSVGEQGKGEQPQRRLPSWRGRDLHQAQKVQKDTRVQLITTSTRGAIPSLTRGNETSNLPKIIELVRH